jgi:hypothetical protein
MIPFFGSMSLYSQPQPSHLLSAAQPHGRSPDAGGIVLETIRIIRSFAGPRSHPWKSCGYTLRPIVGSTSASRESGV